MIHQLLYFFLAWMTACMAASPYGYLYIEDGRNTNLLNVQAHQNWKLLQIMHSSAAINFAEIYLHEDNMVTLQIARAHFLLLRKKNDRYRKVKMSYARGERVLQDSFPMHEDDLLLVAIEDHRKSFPNTLSFSMSKREEISPEEWWKHSVRTGMGAVCVRYSARSNPYLTRMDERKPPVDYEIIANKTTSLRPQSESNLTVRPSLESCIFYEGGRQPRLVSHRMQIMAFNGPVIVIRNNQIISMPLPHWMPFFRAEFMMDLQADDMIIALGHEKLDNVLSREKIESILQVIRNSDRKDLYHIIENNPELVKDLYIQVIIAVSDQHTWYAKP